MPTVFISHSCKDNEVPPAAPTAEQAARQARLVFARTLRDRLHAKLKQDVAFDVFLDVRGGLNPGDIWQDGLHSALRTCDAGVVLLTPESLESGWVLKEATILSWRVFLRERVLLVPVVLGVADAALETRGFGALGLSQIQRVDVKGTDDAAVDNAVARIVDALTHKIPPSGLSSATELSPTETWILELAEQLQFVTAGGLDVLAVNRLKKMCNALGIPAEDRERFDKDPLVKLASHVLMAEYGQILAFLNAAGRPPQAQREELKVRVEALWVDPTPASRVAAGTAKVIALDATEARFAAEYVTRAYCNQLEPDRIIMATEKTDGTHAGTIAAVVDSVGRFFPIRNAAAMTKEVDEHGPLFVILGPGSVRSSVLDELTRDYPQITWVAAAGTTPQARLGDWWDKVGVLQPPLQPTREDEARFFRNRLQAYVTGHA
jgi:hypothetical protein